jgi:long-subunit fatty acid transport protein
VLLCLWLSVTPPAWALLAGNDFFGLDFRFNNPGARANAMGGAFIAVADDATAAYTNPAGLCILTDPEVSLEFKYTETTDVVYDEIGRQEFENDVYNVSFASFVYPKDNATFSVYRHQLVSIESQFAARELPDNLAEVDLDLQVTTLGLSAGFTVAEGFSLGFSVGFARADYQSLETKYDNPDGTPPSEGYVSVSDSDSAEQYSASLLWNPVGEFTLGLVYRYGPEFDTNKSRFEQDPNVPPPDVAYNLIFLAPNTLKIPDTIGLGLAYRIAGALTLALDADYVFYSDLLQDLQFEPGSGLDPSDFDIDDTLEVHFGLEYVLPINDVPFALRAGYFYRPDHGLEYTGPDASLRERLQDRGDDEHIFSAGFGFVVYQNLQIDLAASYGEYITEGTLSAVYRF